MSPMKRKNIVLCGFMGCGKSTVGRALAEKFSAEFVDMDSLIERRENATVAEIFRKKGEEAFRRMETEAALELSGRSGLVIAAGGGVLLNPENVRILRRTGVVVLLSVPVETIARRLEGDATRPLLLREDRAEFLRSLYRERVPRYLSAADVRVDADAPPEEAAGRVFRAVCAFLSEKP